MTTWRGGLDEMSQLFLPYLWVQVSANSPYIWMPINREYAPLGYGQVSWADYHKHLDKAVIFSRNIVYVKDMWEQIYWPEDNTDRISCYMYKGRLGKKTFPDYFERLARLMLLKHCTLGFRMEHPSGCEYFGQYMRHRIPTQVLLDWKQYQKVKA